MIITESESGEKVYIPRSHPAAAEKRLGIRYSLDGTWSKEYAFWKEFSTDFTSTVQKAKLDRSGGYHTYNTLWCSKFRYSAPVISFTETQLTHLQKRIIGPCLAAAGFNSKMPRAVVFGPSLYGGMNWQSPFTIHLYEKIKFVVGSIRLADTVGKLMLLQLQWMQLFAGTSSPLLETDKEIPYLPRCWLQALHSMLIHTTVKIRISKTWLPKPRRINDHVIMDYVRHNLPKEYWAAVNQCRLYLKVVTFSDLVTFDGTTIPDTLFHIRGAYRAPRLKFPYQKRPPLRSREKWQYFIRYISNEKGTLFTTLGQWIRKPYQQFPYVLGKNRSMMYIQTDRHWEIFYLCSGSQNKYMKAGMTVRHLPQQWIPINIIKLSSNIIKGIHPSSTYFDQESVPTKKIGEFDTAAEKNVLGHFEINQIELDTLVNEWSQRPVILNCGSDGGLKDDIGTSGYVLYVGGIRHPDGGRLLRRAPICQSFQHTSRTTGSTLYRILGRSSDTKDWGTGVSVINHISDGQQS